MAKIIKLTKAQLLEADGTAFEYFDADKAGYSGAIGVFIFFFIMLVSYTLNSYFKRKGDALR